MADTTTADAPCHAIRKLIVQTTDEGTELERQVDVFAALAHRAAREFAKEVDPLHLPDESYALVTAASGLSGLLDMAYRMQVALARVVDA